MTPGGPGDPPWPRVGAVVLPEYPWAETRRIWTGLEDLGLHHAWTFDHFAWRSLSDWPWYDAVTTLTAVAAVTSEMSLGTLVASPNLRHPAVLAKQVMSLDQVSNGRFVLGIGAGASGTDTRVLGGSALSPRRRADRFDEFVVVTDLLLRQRSTTWSGEFFSVTQARMHPGCVQQPRVPFALAATGPRGLDLAVRHAQTWVCLDSAEDEATRDEQFAHVAALAAKLDRACERGGRDPRSIDRLVLTGFGPDRPLESVAAFEDSRARYAELGFTDLVVHYPRPADPFAASLDTLEAIAAL